VDLNSAKANLFRSLSNDIQDQRVLGAMAKVPRESFIPEESFAYAYDDRPLSIGFGQTISQPLIVAMMTQALDLKGNEKVLELGTGSGYQTAILCQLSRYVVTVERIAELLERAQKALAKLGCNNVEFHLAEKIIGWAKGKPYDAILVTAAAPAVPDILIQQLKFGGRLIIPVGSKWDQELLKITRMPQKNITQHLGYCRFVPLIGDEAWQDT
jgi:protein-L-isoaspartate(D-aspartate) O-methyltransferase